MANKEEKKQPIDIEQELYFHGIRVPKRLNVRYLKIASVAFAVLGLIVIYVIAQGAPAPLVRIADLNSPMMNYATVRLNGTCTSVPGAKVESGKLRLYFYINDGTGTVNVNVYYPTSIEVVREGKVPLPGDAVEAEVQVRVSEGSVYVSLQAAELIKIKRIPYDFIGNVTSLSIDMENKYVGVIGTAQPGRWVSTGYLFDVATGADTVTVIIPTFLNYTDESKAQEIYSHLSEGAPVYITGRVYLYPGSTGPSPEIVVESLDDIKFIQAVTGKKVTLSDLSNYEGEIVSVDAHILTISYAGGGKYDIKISDGTSEATVRVTRQMLAGAVNPFALGPNALITFSGTVVNSTLAVSSMTQSVEDATPVLKISEIAENLIGTPAAVEGTITRASVVGSGNLKLYVNDGSGELAIFIPSSTAADLADEVKDALTEGTSVRIAGYVDQYKGEMEIVVYDAEGVEILGAGQPVTTTAPSTTTQPQEVIETKLSDLGQYIGMNVSVEVSLGSISYSSGYYYVQVSDSSGSATLKAGRTVMAALNPLEVGTGSTIKVVGKVIDSSNIEAYYITVLSAVPPEKVTASEVTLDIEGKIVYLEGEISYSKVVGSNNYLLKVRDGTGEATVFIPASVVSSLDPEIQNALSVVGTKVKIGGYVSEYKGQPELIPYVAAAIQVLG